MPGSGFRKKEAAPPSLLGTPGAGDGPETGRTAGSLQGRPAGLFQEALRARCWDF